MPKLLMLTARELTRDPRARRAARTARAQGFDVVGVSGAARSESPVPLDGVPVVRVPVDEVSARLRALPLAEARHDSPLGRELRGAYRLLRQAAFAVRLARAGRGVGAVDVVHANDLDTLPAAWYLARRHGARLVYDAHELYSSQEPDPPRLERAALQLAEAALARRADAVVTINREIADELSRRLRLRSGPIVVLSCPALENGGPIEPSEGALRAIYQGAMGPGRSLDDLLAAATLVPEVQLTIRVTGADTGELRRRVAAQGLERRVEVVDPIPPDTLVAGLRDYDVGLIINRPVTRNDELVLPNKLFEYLMAGLAVVAPALPSLGPLVEGEGVGLTFPPGDVEGMAAALNRLAADRGLLLELRERARTAAVERFNAEAQSPLLARAWGRV